MNLKLILTVIGGILLAIGFIKVSIIGYYPREAPLFIGILIAGVVCLLVSKKVPLKDTANRDSIRSNEEL